MNAKILCFASAKGGSGKTIIAASFATILATLGKKILLIDMDSSTNGLSLFYLEYLAKAKRAVKTTKIFPRGILELDSFNISPYILNIQDYVDFIASAFFFQTDSIDDKNNLGWLINNLKALLDKLKLNYDYIILDAQAGSDDFAKLAFINSDEIIIVSEFDPVSMEGVERLKQLYPKYLIYNKTWVLFNKVLPEFAESFKNNLSVARYLNPIPWDIDIIRAYMKRRLAIDMKKGNFITMAMINTIKSLLGDEIEGEIAEWKTKTGEEIVGGINDKLAETEKTLSLYQTRRLKLFPEYRSYVMLTVLKELLWALPLLVLSVVGITSGIFSKLVLENKFILAYAGIMTLWLVMILFLMFRITMATSKIKRKKSQYKSEFELIYEKIAELRKEKEKYKTLIKTEAEVLLAMNK